MYRGVKLPFSGAAPHLEREEVVVCDFREVVVRDFEETKIKETKTGVSSLLKKGEKND
jgi:hypothetical protein